MWGGGWVIRHAAVAATSWPEPSPARKTIASDDLRPLVPYGQSEAVHGWAWNIGFSCTGTPNGGTADTETKKQRTVDTGTQNGGTADTGTQNGGTVDTGTLYSGSADIVTLYSGHWNTKKRGSGH